MFINQNWLLYVQNRQSNETFKNSAPEEASLSKTANLQNCILRHESFNYILYSLDSGAIRLVA